LAGSITQLQQYRLSVFNSIHEIVFHGKGGYDWNVVYNMPLWLRKFTFDKLKEFYSEKSTPKNEETWLKGKAIEAAKNPPQKTKYPKYNTKIPKK
tara:strand:+ start:831 stop:1115 length:285 start_codon:yes stop_codon:yes gene_type:complete